MATITITLLSGAVENECADFTLRLSEAALEQGHKVNIFLLGKASVLGNKETPWPGAKGMQGELAEFMDSFRLAGRIGELASRGAAIHTCHTTEYARGAEGCEYVEGVQRGNVGVSLTKFFITSDVAFTIG